MQNKIPAGIFGLYYKLLYIYNIFINNSIHN
jgi:hypothetical protein